MAAGIFQPKKRISICAAVQLTAFLILGSTPAFAAPELPRVIIDTPYSEPASIVRVAAGGNLQQAINNAPLGTTIELAAGATFTGNFVLPSKTGSGWIYIRTSHIAGLPAPGKRVDPSHAALMAKIVSPNSAPAISTSGKAHHYRLAGLEVTATGNIFGIISLEPGSVSSAADFPNNLVVDRCYIHGAPTADVRRGIALNSGRTAIIDSYISEAHARTSDAQAIGGWMGPGPYKIVNNFLSGSGENFMLGGGDGPIDGLLASDIEFRKNYLFKPLSWRNGTPDWSIKNLFELKVGRRILVEGNVFENNWPDSQNGFGILFTVRNQDGGNPSHAVEDVTFRYNIIKNSTSGLNMHGIDNNFPSLPTRRILVAHNLWENIGAFTSGGGRVFQFVNDGGSVAEVGNDIVIDHNTVAGTVSSFGSTGDDTSHYFGDFAFRNNITPGGMSGFFGSGEGEGLDALNTYFRRWSFDRNVIAGRSSSSYPANNFLPANVAAIGFVDAANGNYRLSTSSPYRGVATDGSGMDPGVNFDALEAAVAGAVDGNGGGGGSPTTTTTTTTTSSTSTTVKPTTTSTTNTTTTTVRPATSTTSTTLRPTTTASSTTSTTLAPKQDETSPVISDVSARIGSSSAIIRWKTGEPADSEIEYWGNRSRKQVRDLNFVTEHRIELLRLRPNTVYRFILRSKDAADNLAASKTYRFTTKKKRMNASRVRVQNLR